MISDDEILAESGGEEPSPQLAAQQFSRYGRSGNDILDDQKFCSSCDGQGCPTCRDDGSYEEHERKAGRISASSASLLVGRRVDCEPTDTIRQSVDLTATVGVQVDVYAAPGNRKVICLSVDGVTRCRVTCPEAMRVEFTADRRMEVVQR